MVFSTYSFIHYLFIFLLNSLLIQTHFLWWLRLFLYVLSISYMLWLKLSWRLASVLWLFLRFGLIFQKWFFALQVLKWTSTVEHTDIFDLSWFREAIVSFGVFSFFEFIEPYWLCNSCRFRHLNRIFGITNGHILFLSSRSNPRLLFRVVQLFIFTMVQSGPLYWFWMLLASCVSNSFTLKRLLFFRLEVHFVINGSIRRTNLLSNWIAFLITYIIIDFLVVALLVLSHHAVASCLFKDAVCMLDWMTLP